MSDRMKVVLVIVAVVVIGLPILGKLANEKPATDQSAPGATDKSGKPKQPAEPAAPLQPPLLNSTNLVNSQWMIPIQGIPVTVTFLAGGVAAANAPGFGQIQGTWSVSGASLTVTATVMNQTHSQAVQISGDQILVNGKPAQRLN